MKAFVPVTDRVLVDHLQGTIVAGVYPLVEGDRCHFVAVDFDGAGWQGDLAAFSEAARAAGLPVALERSRSGNGAHAWFFFMGQVPAVAARQMASYLLTEAMSRRSEIGTTAHDCRTTAAGHAAGGQTPHVGLSNRAGQSASSALWFGSGRSALPRERRNGFGEALIAM